MYKFSAAIVVAFFFLLFLITSFYIVPPGHVGVQVVGGNVTGQLDSGWGFVNPVSDIVRFDCRQKSLEATANIRSQDQLETHFEVSLQYRINPAVAEKTYQETGNAEAVISTHLVPRFQSICREVGRGIADSKEFFNESTQQMMTSSILQDLTEFCATKGLIVTNVLIRDIDPPPFIEEAVQRREEREQETDRQRAELERFEIEQQQQVKAALARADAARADAERIRELAQAEADAHRLRGEALAAYPQVIELERIQKWNGTLPHILTGDNMQMLLPVSEGK